MYQQIYCEINLLCIGILLYILNKMRKSIDKRAANIELIKLIFVLIMILVSDSVWSVLDGRPDPILKFFNYLSCATYMGLSGLVGYYSLSFIECKIGVYYRREKIKKFIFNLPVIILLVLSYSSYFSGLVFEITANGYYQRGDLYFLQPFIPYIYFIISFGYIIVEFKKTKSYQKKQELFTLLSFFIFPSIGGLLGIIFQRMPITWPLTVFSVMLIFSDFQTYETRTDGLTGLNNRRKFNDFLLQQLSSKSNLNHLALFLIDIDSFKAINDTYGHYEGDKALIEVANILISTDSVENQKSFLCRYGGDEFAIIYQYQTQEDIDNLIKRINVLTEKRNEETKKGYNLYLSIGYETFSENGAKDFSSIINGADQSMYAEKRKNKLNRINKVS